MTPPACVKLQPLHLLVREVTKLSKVGHGCLKSPKYLLNWGFEDLCVELWARRAGK